MILTFLSAGPLLLDTGIYIRFYRGEDYDWLGQGARVFARTHLTAAVTAELYAGTRSSVEKHALDHLPNAHQALGHFQRRGPPTTSAVARPT